MVLPFALTSVIMKALVLEYWPKYLFRIPIFIHIEPNLHNTQIVKHLKFSFITFWISYFNMQIFMHKNLGEP